MKVESKIVSAPKGGGDKAPPSQGDQDLSEVPHFTPASAAWRRSGGGGTAVSWGSVLHHRLTFSGGNEPFVLLSEAETTRTKK